MQIPVFLATALLVLESKAFDLHTKLIFFCLGDVNDFSTPMAAALCARFNGKPLPVIDPDVTITAHGHELAVSELIEDAMQHVTQKMLEEDCPFFSVPSTADAIQHCVDFGWANKQQAGPRGQSLMSLIKVHIFAAPIQNHASEAYVQGSTLFFSKYRSNMDQGLLSDLQFGRENFLLLERRDAVDTYLKSKACVF